MLGEGRGRGDLYRRLRLGVWRALLGSESRIVRLLTLLLLLLLLLLLRRRRRRLKMMPRLLLAGPLPLFSVPYLRVRSRILSVRINLLAVLRPLRRISVRSPPSRSRIKARRRRPQRRRRLRPRLTLRRLRLRVVDHTSARRSLEARMYA